MYRISEQRGSNGIPERQRLSMNISGNGGKDSVYEENDYHGSR